MPLHAQLDAHLNKVLGSTAAYTVTGATATIPAATLDARRLQELIDVAGLVKHDVSLTAGVLTIKPR